MENFADTSLFTGRLQCTVSFPYQFCILQYTQHLKKTDENPKALYENVKGEQERLVNFSSVYKWSNLFLHDFNVSFVLWICSTNNVADCSLSFQSQRSWLSVHLEGSGSIYSHHTRLSLNEAASMFICSQVWRQTLHMLSLQVSISPLNSFSFSYFLLSLIGIGLLKMNLY